MSEAYIVRRGGGVKLFAAIGVTYPAGSTLTCTNGTKTLRAKTTSGQWVFAISETGTWTVTATDGTKTKSQTVKITSEGQSVNVALTYALILYDAGNQYTATTGGWGSSVESNGLIEFRANNIYISGNGNNGGDYARVAIFTKNKVNLSGYSRLNITVNVTKVNYSHIPHQIGISDDQNRQSFVAKTTDNTTGTKTLSLDISSYSGAYYVKYEMMGTGTVTKVWLE